MVVLGWREAPYLLNCLESLCRQDASSGPFEVIVFLNEPSAALWQRVQQGVRGARVMKSPANLGFGGGNNAAAEAARGEFLVFLNDDAEAAPNWLGELVQAAAAHPEAGAIGSLVRAWDGTVQEAGGALRAEGHVEPLGHGQPGEDPSLAGIREVDFVSGCSLLVRRSAWLALGGFDERYYPAYYEDVDLCLRLHARGWRTFCAGTSVVRHRFSASVEQRYKDFLLERNRRRLLERLAAGGFTPQPGEVSSLGLGETAGHPDDTRLAMEEWDERAVRALLRERDVLAAFASDYLYEDIHRLQTTIEALERQIAQLLDADAALVAWARDLEAKLLESERRLAQSEGQLALAAWAHDLEDRLLESERRLAESEGQLARLRKPLVLARSVVSTLTRGDWRRGVRKGRSR